MRLGEPANTKTTKFIRGIFGGLGLIFILAFWREIWDVFKIFWTFFSVILLRFPYNDELGKGILDSFAKVGLYNCLFGFGAVFSLWLLLISAQALLPVNNLHEMYRTAWHLWLYIVGLHGPAIFIKDGVEVSTLEDEKRNGHGVIVSDFNSAVVLEQRDVAPGLSRLASLTALNLLYSFGLVDRPVSPRVCGPGIAFTRPGERIRGVVDLRKQFRILPKVTCYTREGIELYANIMAIFTIGMDPEPDALQVTYLGDRRQENLRVCAFTPERGGRFLKLNALNDELDEPDRQEIHAVAASLQMGAGYIPYTPLPKHPLVPTFNEKRVFSAVFAQARNGEQEVMQWMDLPTRVAASFYRELLPTINYDELYDIKGTGPLPLPSFKRKLMLNMRNNGILAYRVVQHFTGEQLVVGKVYHESELVVSEIRQLTNSKLLRDRGIKIIMSGFGDLFPVNQQIYQQRLDSWRANWERELDVTLAGHDLQTMRVRSRAMADAQHDLWYHLNQLFTVQEYSDEALAIRVMQALETAANDPKTRDLLPGHTIDIMNHINGMLLPQPAVQAASASYLPPGEPPNQGGTI